jgi:hypothetical protein
MADFSSSNTVDFMATAPDQKNFLKKKVVPVLKKALPIAERVIPAVAPFVPVLRPVAAVIGAIRQ